jgi:glutamate synthase (NADPH/NADH) large chain
MSGGVAYVYDEDGLFAKRCNLSMVSLEKVDIQQVQPKVPQHLNQPDEVILKTLIEKHHKYTDSERAKFILDNWEKERAQFIKVMPNEYKRALNELHALLTKEAA